MKTKIFYIVRYFCALPVFITSKSINIHPKNTGLVWSKRNKSNCWVKLIHKSFILNQHWVKTTQNRFIYNLID